MKRLAIVLGLTVVSSAGWGQNALPDWVLRLARVKSHLKDNFERTPNYVCREDVVRYGKASSEPRRVRIDSLRFDVAQIDGKELTATPGAGGFEEPDFKAYTSTGTGFFGTGTFASLPMHLFVGDTARIAPHPARGRREAWDYEIPAFLRGFQIEWQGIVTKVGVRGTFWVDRETMDLVRTEEQVADPPLQTGMKASDSVVENARMHIGNSSVLLPQSAVMVVVNLDGTEKRNELKFSDCREYTAESKVIFGVPKQ